MARIAGFDLPRNKRVEIGLTYIFGIGRSTSQEILKTTDINPDTRVKDLSETEVARLREVIVVDGGVEPVDDDLAEFPGRIMSCLVRAENNARAPDSSDCILPQSLRGEAATEFEVDIVVRCGQVLCLLPAQVAAT